MGLLLIYTATREKPIRRCDWTYPLISPEALVISVFAGLCWNVSDKRSNLRNKTRKRLQAVSAERGQEMSLYVFFHNLPSQKHSWCHQTNGLNTHVQNLLTSMGVSTALKVQAQPYEWGVGFEWCHENPEIAQGWWGSWQHQGACMRVQHFCLPSRSCRAAASKVCLSSRGFSAL